MSLAEEERSALVSSPDAEMSAIPAPAAPAAPARVSAPAVPATAGGEAPRSAPAAAVAASPATAASPKARSKRKVALLSVALAALLGGAAYALYYFLVLAHY
ncbi:MAG: hypothetical protein ABI218_01785, partial [Caldimonas sp.]